MDLTDCWPLARGEHVRERLVQAYADPARGYHDLRHLEEVCGRIEELTISGGVSCDRVAVLLAAWFHDAVYDGDAAAEDRSAAWAEHELPALGLGIGWASIMGNPYIILASSIPPERTGVYMGIFNMMIVIPMPTSAMGAVDTSSG